MLAQIAIFCAIGYFWQGYSENKWWTSGYVYSLLIPITLFFSAAWFSCVPKELSISDKMLSIRYYLREKYTLYWKDLLSWGYEESGFYMEFDGSGVLPIPMSAFSRQEQAQLIGFLSTHFPECKAGSWGQVDKRMFFIGVALGIVLLSVLFFVAYFEFPHMLLRDDKILASPMN